MVGKKKEMPNTLFCEGAILILQTLDGVWSKTGSGTQLLDDMISYSQSKDFNIEECSKKNYKTVNSRNSRLLKDWKNKD